MSSVIPAGCWDLDLATGSLALCRESRAMFGLGTDSPDRLTETEWTSRFHPGDLPSVREALAASLVHRAPYAQRFRTIHPDGSIHLVLGIGRPVEYGRGPCRFVGWNFDVVSTGDMAADWISAHPEAVNAEHRFSLVPSAREAEDRSALKDPPDALAREQLFSRAICGEPAFDCSCLFMSD